MHSHVLDNDDNDVIDDDDMDDGGNNEKMIVMCSDAVDKLNVVVEKKILCVFWLLAPVHLLHFLPLLDCFPHFDPQLQFQFLLILIHLHYWREKILPHIFLLYHFPPFPLFLPLSNSCKILTFFLFPRYHFLLE